MTSRPLDALRIARQCVATDRYFGLDAIPMRSGPPTSSEPAAPEESARQVEFERPRLAVSEVELVDRPPTVASAVVTARGRIPTLRQRLDVRSLLSADDRTEALEALRERHARECPHCTTATYHTNLVFGEGSPVARLVFVGEAPGETEDEMGRPFVGRAGQKLDEMIRAIGMERGDVYIANVLKSRPPENRTPLQHEVDGCGPYLVEQLRILQPSVIVTLGGPATKLLLATDMGITRLRGVWASFRTSRAPSDEVESPSDAMEIPVMPTFHPAYLLRNYTPETRRQVWSDLQAVLARLRA